MASIWTKKGHRTGRPVSRTGRTLAQSMGLPVNVDDGDVIIRWGSTAPSNTPAVEINKRDAIILSSDKPEARRLLREAGLPVPCESETEFPVVARARRHHAGSGLWYCNDSVALDRARREGAVYFSRFYPKTREIRVHVAGGKTLLVSEKEGGDRSLVVWNHSTSAFQLRHLHRHVWREDRNLMAAVRSAKSAIAALGLDFGAVDVMLAPSDGQASHVICEVNTAPALSPLAMQKYVDYLTALL